MKKLRILWPISPRDEAPQATEQIVRYLESLKKVCEFEVQPVSVVSSVYMATSYYFEPIDTAELVENVRQDVNHFLQNHQQIPLLPPRILENLLSSQRAESQILVDFVRDYDADLVLMASNGRQGWARAFLGSFAESFILQSPSPVLVFGPMSRATGSFNKALLPVEVDESSQNFMKDYMASTAAKLYSSLELFHKLTLTEFQDVAWAGSFYGGKSGESNLLVKAKAKAQDFLSHLQKIYSSQAKLEIQVSEQIDPVAQVLVEQSNRDDLDLLVMRSDVGPVAAVVLGSVTRSVVRESKLPVLVYPHK